MTGRSAPDDSEPSHSAAIVAALRADCAYFAIILLYIAAGAVLFSWYGLPFFRLSNYRLNAILYLASAIIVIGPLIAVTLLRERPESPIALVRELPRRWRLGERTRLALPAIIGLIVFLPAFSAFKSAISVFHPFHLDPLFADIDARLHGGDAWRLIQPVIGHAPVTFAISCLYQLWILLLYPGVLIATSRLGDRQLRNQFLLSFLLCWILIGTAAATWLSSVGPCFYEAIYGSDRFKPLMDYLAGVDRNLPIAALDIQRELLEAYFSADGRLGRGISAMPSMHLAIATLFALWGWRVSRMAGWGLSLFAAAILIGSVHLGYHYAIDGYVSILATIAIWVGCGKISARKTEKPGLNP